MAFTTVEECKEECTKTEGCVVFTTVAGTTNLCFLKNKDHAAESANAKAISARMSCYEGNIEKQSSPTVNLMCRVNNKLVGGGGGFNPKKPKPKMGISTSFGFFGFFWVFWVYLGYLGF